MSGTPTVVRLQENVPLAPYTTLALGGPARFFTEPASVEEIRGALAFAREASLRWFILGGGSNVIVPDRGFDGLVIRVATRGRAVYDDDDGILVTLAAGEAWDPFVAWAVGKGYGGVECLSGIPGLVGATPIQNVGAYGQEVSETVVSVMLLDASTLEETELPGTECGFAYRESRFRGRDAGRYVITGVTFRLKKDAPPSIRYPELREYIDATSPGSGDIPAKALDRVRRAVLNLRKKKSMVLDPADPNTRSVGSFFTNPVLTRSDFEHLKQRHERLAGGSPIPSFPSPAGIKVPAAWLVEQAGFPKGFTRGGAGISANHSLALVNRGGSTADLLALADAVQDGVFTRFGVRLQREPILID